MITLCAVKLERLDRHIEILLDSIANRTTLISKVLLAQSEVERPDINWTVGNKVEITEFYFKCTENLYNHAYGFHACLDRLETDYVLFSDPDVFFYDNTDKFYLDTLNNYNLSVIGTSDDSLIMCYGFFPTAQNMLFRRDWLPSVDFLKDYKRRNALRATACNVSENLVDIGDKYLLHGPIPEFWQSFPNPSGSFDMGCNLWLWCNMTKGSWLSFQSLDGHNYQSVIYKNNAKIKSKFPRRKLIYHLGRSTLTSNNLEIIENYRDIYKKSGKHSLSSYYN